MDSDKEEIANHCKRSGKGPPHRKKIKPLTPAERKRISRALMSGVKKKEDNARNQQRMANQRAEQPENKRKESKAKDQQRMANQREEQPENKRKEAKAKDQHRKANKRAEDKRQEANAKCNEDSDEDENVEKNREEIIKRMRAAGIAEKRKMRDGRSFEQWEEDFKQDRERKKNQKEGMDEVEREFGKINCKHQKRKLRSERTGKEKLQQNLKAKKGMRIFREVGRFIDHKDRIKQNSSEVVDWERFQKESKSNADMIDEMKPDNVQQINEKMREERERLRKKRIKSEEKEAFRIRQIEEDGGESVHNAEYDDYYWVGEGEPPR